MIIRGLLIISPDVAQLQTVLLYLHAAPHADPKCEENGEMVESTTTRGNREYSSVDIISANSQHVKLTNSHTPPPSANKVAHPVFETQRTRHQKPKTGVLVVPPKINKKHMELCFTNSLTTKLQSHKLVYKTKFHMKEKILSELN